MVSACFRAASSRGVGAAGKADATVSIRRAGSRSSPVSTGMARGEVQSLLTGEGPTTAWGERRAGDGRQPVERARSAMQNETANEPRFGQSCDIGRPLGAKARTKLPSLRSILGRRKRDVIVAEMYPILVNR